MGLGRFQVQRVVDGHGNLAGYPLHELEFDFGDALGHQAAEGHGPEPTLRGGEGNEREGTHALIAKALHKFGIAVFFGGIADDERLLRLPDPAGRVPIDRSFGTDAFLVWDARLQEVKAHDIARRVVEREGEEIEIDDRVQAAGEIMEQGAEVALLGDGFADFQQGFELLARVFRRRRRRRFRRGDDRVRHSWQDSIRSAGAQPGQGARGGWGSEAVRGFRTPYFFSNFAERRVASAPRPRLED